MSSVQLNDQRPIGVSNELFTFYFFFCGKSGKLSGLWMCYVVHRLLPERK